MHQTCKDCGRVQRFEFSVADELWRRSGGGRFALCIECWLERAEAAGIGRIDRDEFRFLAIVGTDRLFCTLLDRDEEPAAAAPQPQRIAG